MPSTIATSSERPASEATGPAPAWGDPADPVVPSREDPTVASASHVLGGPVGRFALVGASGVAAAVGALCAAVTGLVALGVVERAHCVQVGWTSPDHFWHACYSDVPVLYGSSGMSTGLSPFAADSSFEQPLPTTVVAWLLARLVPSGTPLTQSRWYFALWSLVTVVALVGLVAALARGQRRHPWRAAHLASPALPFLALVSFEVVPVALAGLGLAAWGRRRTVLAGVLLGLAVLARPLAVLALVAVLLLAVRAGRVRAALPTVGTALLVAGVALLAGRLLGGPGAVSAYTQWWSAPAGYGSVWFLARLAGAEWAPALLSIVSVMGWVAAVVAGAALALTSTRRPRLGELLLVMTAVVVLTGRSMPVQSGLWMLLLLAVTGVRWRLHLVWAAIEVAYFVAVWLHIAATSAPDRGLPAGWYAVFLVARVVAWAVVVADVWRRAQARPAAPVVEAPAPAHGPTDRAGAPDAVDDGVLPARAAVVEDDELAGPLAGAPDHTVVTFA